MARKSDVREKLVRFLDRKAFDPVLRANPSDFKQSDWPKLRHLQQSTQSEKARYHHNYRSAKEVHDQFHGDLSSSAAKRIHEELKELHLPTLPEIRDQFDGLCERLGVR